MEKTKTNKKFVFIFAALILVGGSYGTYKYLHSLAHETTDDAQIEKNMNPIIPRVAGYVTKVYVKDNDFVKKGDTLFTIDNKDYLVKINAEPKFFDEHEMATITVLGDIIMPKDETSGSASEAKVPEFIEFIVKRK